MSIRILQGDVRDMLKTLPAESVHCVVTSPPYWGLRDYGTAEWKGGDPGCIHRFGNQVPDSKAPNAIASGVRPGVDASHCKMCGATRIDNQLGLEPTMAEHIDTMVDVFREVRRVMRKDGTVWLNYGDCYSTHQTGRIPDPNAKSTLAGIRHQKEAQAASRLNGYRTVGELAEKQLCMIPNRLAVALQEPYYTGKIKAERDRVWMAAMIDGEGTICGFRHERPNGNIRTGTLVFITNGNEAILDECERIWPGARYLEHLKAGDEVLGATATKDCWRWQIQMAEDRSLYLREIYPYLVAKKKQALVAYNLTEFSIAGKKHGRGGDSNSVKEKRQVLAALLSDLNQGRPCDLPSWLKEPPSVFEQGWWVRSEVIWHKNNPMPESVTDRPATAHEKVWLLTKSARYYYDAEAVRTASTWEPSKSKMPDGWDTGPGAHGTIHRNGREKGAKTDKQRGHSRRHAGFNDRWDAMTKDEQQSNGANLRNVWTIPTKGYSEAHFATFPPALVEPCIKAGTSEKGCCAECGAPWVRETSVEFVKLADRNPGRKAHQGNMADINSHEKMGFNRTSTLGWSPSCACNADTTPCAVLDPFGGSGTTGMVADRLGRNAILIELNPEYADMARERLTKDAGMFAEVS